MADVNERNELERRIAARLAQLDEESLRRLDAISEYAAERARPLPLPIGGATADSVEATTGGLSRRKFLVGAGVVIAGTAAGGALVGAALASPEAEKLKELLKMRALVALYEELEKAGLDALVAGGLAALGAALEIAKNVAGAVGAGIKLVDVAVVNVERLFPAARQAVVFAEGLVKGLAQSLRDVQLALNAVTGTVRPVTDVIGGFYSDLLDKIPFGVGTNVRIAVNNVVFLVTSIPAIIDGINTQVIAPLRTEWFSDDDKKGLKGNLLEPVRKNLLQPADSLVGQVGKTAEEYQRVITPVNKALAQRAEVRKQIVDVQDGRLPTPVATR